MSDRSRILANLKRKADAANSLDTRKSRRSNPSAEVKICPITLEEVEWPNAFTLTADGQTYNKDAILHYYELKKALDLRDNTGISSPVNTMPFTIEDITRLEALLNSRRAMQPRTPPTPRVNRGRVVSRNRGRGRGRRGRRGGTLKK